MDCLVRSTVSQRCCPRLRSSFLGQHSHDRTGDATPSASISLVRLRSPFPGLDAHTQHPCPSLVRSSGPFSALISLLLSRCLHPTAPSLVRPRNPPRALFSLPASPTSVPHPTPCPTRPCGPPPRLRSQSIPVPSLPSVLAKQIFFLLFRFYSG